MADKLRIEIIPSISTVAIQTELKKVNDMVTKNKLAIPLKPIDKKVSDSINKTKTGIAGLVSAIGKVAIWTVATTAIFGTIRAAKNLVKEFVVLQDQLIAIERVTKGLDLTVLFDKSLEAADNLGVGLKDVLAITEELGRTYADLDETQLQLAASNAVLLASVTDLTSEAAVSGLIAITQAYNIAIEDSISVVDALNVVNNNYAIGADDLSRSLERSASAAAEVGVSFENLIGYTTAIKTSTRESGSVIGNSLKTIVIRLQSNAEAIREVEQAGVAVYGEDGQLRRAEDIINDIALKWDTLSKNQKVNIGVAVAGQRQYTRFAALMQNFDIATNAANDAVSNQGNALEENEKRMKTVSAQLEILSNSALNLSQVVGTQLAPIMVGLIKLMQTFIDTLTWIVDTFGLGTIAALAFTITIAKLSTMTIQFASAIKVLSGAMKLLSIAAPWLLAVAAIGLVINSLIKYNKVKKAEIKLQKESAINVINEGKTIKELADRYSELSKATSLTSEQESELLDVQRELITLVPSLTTIQDAYGNAVLATVSLLRQELNLINQVNLAKAASDMNTLAKEIDSVADGLEVITGFEDVADFAGGFRTAAVRETFENIEAITNAFNRGEIGIQEYKNALDNAASILAENTQLYIDYSNAATLATMGTLDIGDANNEIIGTFNNLVASEELVISNLSGISSAFTKLIVNLDDGVDGTVALENAFTDLGFNLSEFMDAAEEFELDGFTEEELNNFDIFKNIMQDAFGITEDTIGATNKAIDIIKLYGNAVSLTESQQNEYNKSLDFLSDIFPELDDDILGNMKVVEAYAESWTLAADNQEAYIRSVSMGVIPVNQEVYDSIIANSNALKIEQKSLEDSIARKEAFVAGALGRASVDKSVIDSINEEKEALEGVEIELLLLGDTPTRIEVVDLANLMDAEQIFEALLETQDEMSDNFIDNLEEQKDAFSGLIDHQLDELDRLEESAKFEDRIQDFATEQLSLEQQIARLRNDNSIEGISKRQDLEEQLAKSKEELDDELQERDFDLRRNNLETIQEMVMNDYDDRIEREKELNEVIKERIEAQSLALSNDVEALEALQNVLLGSDGDGLSGFFQNLVDLGLFDLSGVGTPGNDNVLGVSPSEDKASINIENITLTGAALIEDGRNIARGIIDFAEERGLTAIIKNR